MSFKKYGDCELTKIIKEEDGKDKVLNICASCGKPITSSVCPNCNSGGSNANGRDNESK